MLSTLFSGRNNDLITMDPFTFRLRSLDNDNFVIEPKVSLISREKEYVLKAEVPGMSKEDLNLNVNGNEITLSGEKKCHYENDDQATHVHREETSYGKFSRTVKLPRDSDMASLDAKYNNGVLELNVKKLPPPAEQQGKKIAIK